jgi:hypothetical protein
LEVALPTGRYHWSPSKLRNGIDNWRDITPKRVEAAVDVLRRRFSQQALKVAHGMQQRCFLALHKGMGDQLLKVDGSTQISTRMALGLSELAFNTVDSGQTESQVFKFYFDHAVNFLTPKVKNFHRYVGNGARPSTHH